MRELFGIAAVFVGGTCGSLARMLLDGLFEEPGGIPLGILVANVLGAFLLALLLEGLVFREGYRWHAARLLLGTGVLGGFTTYSALATGALRLMIEGAPLLGVAYGLATVIAGASASWAGIVFARRLRAARERKR